MSEQYKFLLSESEMPTQWYNIIPDLPNPLPPPLNPQTMEPIGPEDLAPLFPMGLILQEVSQDSFIDIPKPVLDLYKLYRPSPLFRAVRLEKALGTKSRIYYKYEVDPRLARINLTLQSPKRFITRKKVLQKWLQKQVLANGALLWLLHARLLELS